MDISFDPLAEGFFRDESLEFAERIGLALKSGARKIPISFDRNILPQAYMRPAVGGASFTFSDSIRYDASREEELVRLHPEEEAAIRARGRKWRAYQEECFQYVSPRHDTLVRAGAEWGGGWGGHSNPDFGRIVNLGTDGIREKIALFRGKNTDDCDWFYRACEDAMDALDILGGRFRDLALDPRNIGLLGKLVPVRAKRLRDFLALREHHDAARLAVEPMDEPHVLSALRLALPHIVVEPLLGGVRLLRPRVRRQHPRGLVDDNHIPVFMQDRKWKS